MHAKIGELTVERVFLPEKRKPWIGNMLADLGYETVEAADRKEAIEVLQQTPEDVPVHVRFWSQSRYRSRLVELPDLAINGHSIRQT